MNAEDLAGHPLWERVDSTKRLVARALDGATAEEAVLLATWSEVLEFIGRLRAVESWRFAGSLDVLGKVETVVEELVQDVQPIIDDPEAPIADPLAQRLDAVGAILATAPQPVVRAEHLEGTSSLVAELEKSVGVAVGAMRDRSATSIEEVSELLKPLKTEVSEAQAALAVERGKLEQSVAGNEASFATNLKKWEQDAEGARTADAALSEAARKVQDERANRLIESMEKMVADSQNMSHVVAKNILSTEYAQYARNQGVAATAWSVGAVVLAVVTLGSMLLLVRDIQSITWGEALFKGTLSTGLLATAGFMGREGTGHRKEARDAKRTQLDMNTLEPYVANLPETERLALRVKFANEIFGRPPANGPHELTAPVEVATSDEGAV